LAPNIQRTSRTMANTTTTQEQRHLTATNRKVSTERH